eukprot:GEMP01003417.1.p1 GENE.GEMP01003417.1~~GEMP01003417.1.p1  ORF type:complete len:1224 (+),score=308.54 GEMP01003417.1:37-3672(+)
MGDCEQELDLDADEGGESEEEIERNKPAPAADDDAEPESFLMKIYKCSERFLLDVNVLRYLEFQKEVLHAKVEKDVASDLVIRGGMNRCTHTLTWKVNGELYTAAAAGPTKAQARPKAARRMLQVLPSGDAVADLLTTWGPALIKATEIFVDALEARDLVGILNCLMPLLMVQESWNLAPVVWAWRMVLAIGSPDQVDQFVDVLVHSSIKNCCPAKVWETLLDEATFIMRSHNEQAVEQEADWRSLQALLKLRAVRVHSGAFYSVKAQAYFLKFRPLLQLEIAAGLRRIQEDSDHAKDKVQLLCSTAQPAINEPFCVTVAPWSELRKDVILEGDIMLVSTATDAHGAAVRILTRPDVLSKEFIIEFVTAEPAFREWILRKGTQLNASNVFPAAPMIRQQQAMRALCFKQHEESYHYDPGMRDQLLGDDIKEAVPPVEQAPDILTDEQLYAKASQFFQSTPEYQQIVSNPALYATFQQNPVHWQSYIIPIMQHYKQEQEQHIAQSKQVTPDGPENPQQKAIDLATNPKGPISLIQGPPGTGKTYVACRILEQWIKTKNSTGKLLAVADTNVAADNIQQGLVGLGITTSARVGMGGDDNLQMEQMERHPRWRELEHLENRHDIKRARELRFLITREIITSSDILIATCIGVGNEKFHGFIFDKVVIDECTQAVETASLVALARGAKEAVLIGDHLQLPPTIFTNAATYLGYKISLYERCVKRNLPLVELLDQRRMHSTISAFPNHYIYNDRLKNAVKDQDRPQIEELWWSWDFRCVFVDVGAPENSSRGSKINSVEAQAVLKTFRDVVEQGMDPRDIGILTPYSAQKLLLKKYLAREYPVQIDTIDGFQGKEKELILFSSVRSNTHGNVGFLKDSRRMNVMLTRARRGLVVFGSAKTLRKENGLWALWIEWVARHNAVVPVVLWNKRIADKSKENNANPQYLQARAARNKAAADKLKKPKPVAAPAVTAPSQKPASVPGPKATNNAPPRPTPTTDTSNDDGLPQELDLDDDDFADVEASPAATKKVASADGGEAFVLDDLLGGIASQKEAVSASVNSTPVSTACGEQQSPSPAIFGFSDIVAGITRRGNDDTNAKNDPNDTAAGTVGVEAKEEAPSHVTPAARMISSADEKGAIEAVTVIPTVTAESINPDPVVEMKEAAEGNTDAESKNVEAEGDDARKRVHGEPAAPGGETGKENGDVSGEPERKRSRSRA